MTRDNKPEPPDIKVCKMLLMNSHHSSETTPQQPPIFFPQVIIFIAMTIKKQFLGSLKQNQ